MDGDPALIPVSMFPLIKFSAEFFEVLGLEILFCAVQQNSKVFAFDAEFPADFVPVTFVEEDGLEERSVLCRHSKQDLPDFGLNLAGGRNAVSVRIGRWQLGGSLLIERLAAGGGTVMLEEHVIADCVYEGAKAFGLAQGTRFPQACQHACKRLLTHVFDRLRGLKPRTKLQLEQFGEVRNEMLLSAGVPSAEIFDVSRIECMKLQSSPRKVKRT
jgi:hypothetical protein